MNDDFSVSVSDLTFVGNDLARPECVLATKRGDLYVSDRRGGVTRIFPDGRQQLIAGQGDVLPNGIALTENGDFLIANLHGTGGVWRIDAAGQLSPFIQEADGVALPAVNFVRLDDRGRLWICANPPLAGDRYRTELAEGYIAVVDAAGARVVADGIGWANECLIHPSGKHLYINETFGRRMTRFDIGADATLSNRTVVTEFGHGTYPDGIGLDEEDGLWVVSVASNRLIRVAADGRQHVVLEDSDPAYLDKLEDSYRQHNLTRSDLTRMPETTLKNLSSIAFGGLDRRTAYLGSIGGNKIASFRLPVAGVAPVHWNW